MKHYLWPALVFAAAYGAWHYNGAHTDQKILFPLIEVIVPSTAGNPEKMGEASVIAIVGVGVLFLLLAVRDHARSRRRARELAAMASSDE